MKHIFLVAALLLISSPAVVAAQSPFGDRATREMPTDESDFYTPPAIFVDGITLSQSSLEANTDISGSFQALSMDAATISDITYRIELLGASPEAAEINTVAEDAPSVYGRVVAEESFSLGSHEKKQIPFSYHVPSVPGGDYRIRIQLTSSRGKDLGWDDESVAIAANSISYAQLLPGPITIPEYDNKEFGPDSGPNVSPEQPFTLHALATNTASDAVSFVPSLTVSSVYDKANTTTVTREPILLDSGVETPVAIPLTAPKVPGVYVASLILTHPTTSDIASPILTYRFIVRGNAAAIIGLRLGKIGTRQGEKVEVELNAVGPADAEHTVQASLAFELIDDTGSVGALTVPESLSLNDAVFSGVANVTMNRAFTSHPKLRATLTDESGVTLDSYTVDIPSSASLLGDVIPKTPMKKLIAGIGLLVIILLGLITYRLRRKSPVASALVVMMVIGAGVSALLAFRSVEASTCTLSSTGNGILVARSITGCQYPGDWSPLRNTPFVEMFINRPIHDAPVGTYRRSAVPLEFRVGYATCNNRLGGTYIYADYLRNGGKISTIEAPSGNSWVRSWWSDQMFLLNCPEDAGCGTHVGGQVYLNSGSYSGTFDFDQLDPLASDTTFRLAALWDWNMAAHASKYNADTPIGPRNSSSSNYIDRVNRNIINLWLNIPPSQADLSLIKTGPTTIAQNSQLSYTLTVQNTSSIDASRFDIRDPIPNGLSFVAAGSSPECRVSGTAVVCTIDSLLAHATVFKTIIFSTPQGQQTENLPSSYVFANRTAMVDFVNSLGRFPSMVPNGDGAVGFRSDAATRLALCNLKGYSSVTSYSDSRFTHPSDNNIATWDGNTFTLQGAVPAGNPKKLSMLSCSQPTVPTVPSSLVCDTTISNTATIVSLEDPVMTNNSSTATTTFTCPPVTPTPIPLPVSVNLLINGSETPAPVSINTPITLSWTSTNADTCTATGDWTGTKVATGSESTTPTQIRTYTYTITCTNTASGETGTDTGNIVVNALAGSGNHAPVGVAGIGINGAPASSTVTVQKGTPVQVLLSAEGSSDPDGWTTALTGVSSGGKCEWNSDLNQGAPTFEQTVPNPGSPASCNVNLGTLTFNDTPGTYTYQLLKITDAAGAVSNSGAATVIVTDGPTPTPTPSPSLSASPSPSDNGGGNGSNGSGGFEETR
jgi:uncharacterized repeat protein (TIGR01451 family)